MKEIHIQWIDKCLCHPLLSQSLFFFGCRFWCSMSTLSLRRWSFHSFYGLRWGRLDAGLESILALRATFHEVLLNCLSLLTSTLSYGRGHGLFVHWLILSIRWWNFGMSQIWTIHIYGAEDRTTEIYRKISIDISSVGLAPARPNYPKAWRKYMWLDFRKPSVRNVSRKSSLQHFS